MRLSKRTELINRPALMYTLYAALGLIVLCSIGLVIIWIIKRKRSKEMDKEKKLGEKPKFLENIADYSVSIEAQHYSNCLPSPYPVYIPPESDFEDISILEAYQDKLDSPPKYNLPNNL